MDWTLIDWSWLASINLLQVCVVILALWIVIRILIKFWPWLRKLMELTAALAQLPAFIVRTDASLAAQDKRVAEIHHETHNNDGSSIKDATERIELGVRGLYDRVGVIDETLAALKTADGEATERIKAIEKTIPRDELGRFTNKEIKPS